MEKSVSQDSKNFAGYFLDKIFEKLGSCDFDSASPYLRMLKSFLLQSQSRTITKLALPKFNELLQANAKFYKFTELGINTLLKMINKSAYVYNW
jgi:hypothetical protein